MKCPLCENGNRYYWDLGLDNAFLGEGISTFFCPLRCSVCSGRGFINTCNLQLMEALRKDWEHVLSHARILYASHIDQCSNVTDHIISDLIRFKDSVSPQFYKLMSSYYRSRQLAQKFMLLAHEHLKRGLPFPPWPQDPDLNVYLTSISISGVTYRNPNYISSET